MNPSRSSLSPSATCCPRSQALSRGPKCCSCKQQCPPIQGWAGRRGTSHLLLAHLLRGQDIHHRRSFAHFHFFPHFLLGCLRKESKAQVCAHVAREPEGRCAAQSSRAGPGHKAHLRSWRGQDEEGDGEPLVQAGSPGGAGKPPRPCRTPTAHAQPRLSSALKPPGTKGPG